MFSNWYSGATLFAILLNYHSKITCNGETFPFRAKDIDLYTCSCGKPLLQCEYYRMAGKHMFDNEKKRWNRELFVVLPKLSKRYLVDKYLLSFNYFYKFRDLITNYIPAYRTKIEQMLNAHLKYFINSCKTEKSSVYIDGTKSVRRAELFIKHSNIPFKVIYLIRDGRGFCCSYLKNNHLPKNKIREAVKAWLEYIKMVDIFSARYPHIPLLTIRYEDICRNQKNALSDVYDFLQLTLNDNDLRYTNRQCHLLGNTMRKQFDGNVKEDISWQLKFTSKEINTVTNLMEKELKRFGYI